jgi:aminoglycoside phosphotransferase (APT) family kinase protein
LIGMTVPPAEPGLSPAVAGWLTAHVPGFGTMARVTRLAGGRSNLTFSVTDDGGHRVVLRRPPLGEHPANAHDVLREAGLLQGLAGEVPVPRVLASCADPEVTGAPFVVLEFLDGLVLRDPAGVEAALPVAERAAVGPALVDALAALHRVDPARLGLGALTQRRDFLARQLRRWQQNWQRTATRPLPALERAHARLVELLPAQQRTGIVHGDYRLDNCMLGRDAGGALTVQGILDWELTTVGDPLADLGQFLVYWAEPGDAATALHAPPTALPGFTGRDELADRYFTALGTDPVPVDYHLAFNWWKTACIVENVYGRMVSGAMGTTDRTPESFGAQAAGLAEQAWAQASRLS